MTVPDTTPTDINILATPLEDEPATNPDAAIQPATAQRSVSSLVWEVVQTLVLAGLLIVFFRNFVFQNYIVEGNSMLPTLLPNERVIVGRINYLLGKPQRGDVIVFEYPNDPSRDFVKRIIGLPGETVSIDNGIVSIDGKPLPPEIYLEYTAPTSLDPQTLGDDQYFVMGDNRPGSSDSRSWGPLPRRNIIGKAWLVYFPLNRFGIVPHVDLDLGDDAP